MAGTIDRVNIDGRDYLKAQVGDKSRLFDTDKRHLAEEWIERVAPAEFPTEYKGEFVAEPAPKQKKPSKRK